MKQMLRCNNKIFDIVYVINNEINQNTTVSSYFIAFSLELDQLYIVFYAFLCRLDSTCFCRCSSRTSLKLGWFTYFKNLIESFFAK